MLQESQSLGNMSDQSNLGSGVICYLYGVTLLASQPVGIFIKCPVGAA